MSLALLDPSRAIDTIRRLAEKGPGGRAPGMTILMISSCLRATATGQFHRSIRVSDRDLTSIVRENWVAGLLVPNAYHHEKIP
jgi:hypothetical protein